MKSVVNETVIANIKTERVCFTSLLNKVAIKIAAGHVISFAFVERMRSTSCKVVQYSLLNAAFLKQRICNFQTDSTQQWKNSCLSLVE